MRLPIRLQHFMSIASLYLLTYDYCSAQQSPRFRDKDLSVISGCWEGSLSYLDYTSNKTFTMPADLVIKKIGHTRSFLLSNIYPNEPKANSSDTIILSKDGKRINNETIRSRLHRPNGDLVIVSELTGEDGNDRKEAIFRYTYTIGRETYIHRKEVQFKGQSDWIIRHEYKYSRKACR